MTAQAEMRRAWQLRMYLLASHCFPLLAKSLLQRRRARGKEHPSRWVEKMARGLAPRPKGRLIWLHAVGLGEILSLRGLIVRMAAQAPDAHFLVTSSTVASADVLAKNMPPRTLHQFLPLDAPPYRSAFLDHFHPDLCVWVEQDLWPGLVSELARRSIPQAMIAVRMDAKSFEKHQKVAGLYRDLYAAMQLITAQDAQTAAHLTTLGAPEPVAVTGSLKPAAPTLNHDPDALDQLKSALAERMVWAVAPSHPADEAIAIAAHQTLLETRPDALLIIAPRFPARADKIMLPRPAPLRSGGETPAHDDPIWICDSFGELGLIFRLARVVLIGGTFSEVEGHNPWEAANLGCAIAHGSRTAHFAADFEMLDKAGAAILVNDAAGLAKFLQTPGNMAAQVADLVATVSAKTDDLAQELLALVAPHDG